MYTKCFSLNHSYTSDNGIILNPEFSEFPEFPADHTNNNNNIIPNPENSQFADQITSHTSAILDKYVISLMKSFSLKI